MKRKHKMILLVIVALMTTYTFACTSIPFFPDRTKSMSDIDCLIKTNWQQMGGFTVHINQGQGGQDDGWYDFYQGILRSDDNALRVVYTSKPV